MPVRGCPLQLFGAWKSMRQLFRSRGIGVVLSIGFAMMAGVATPAVAAECYNAEDMAQKVAESGMAWERRTEKVWRVDMPSRTRGEINVIAVCGEKYVPVFSVLAYGKDLKQSPELFMLLLRAADHFDQVKFAVDGDGDYLVRIDLWSQSYSGAALADAANQVRAVIDAMTEGLREQHANR